MVVVLTAPLARECCLPVTQASLCHETKQNSDLTCSSNPQAIAVTKVALGLGLSRPYEAAIASEATFAFVLNNRVVSTTRGFGPTPPSDIYLRTGALLI
jgi:hypothetical protein